MVSSVLWSRGGDIGQYNEAVYAAVFQGRKENIEDMMCSVTARGFWRRDVPAFRQSLNSAEHSEKRLMLDKYGWKEEMPWRRFPHSDSEMHF